MSDVAARPPSHSGRYKRGARATSGKIRKSGSWQLQVEALQGKLSERDAQLAALKEDAAQAKKSNAAEMQKLEEELTWERKRRLQLEGAEAIERAARQQFRDVRSLVRQLRQTGQLSSGAAAHLLRELS